MKSNNPDCFTNVTRDEAFAEVQKLRAQDITVNRTSKTGAMSKSEMEWLEGTSKTYLRPDTNRIRFVDWSLPPIILEYRRISRKLDKKKEKALVAKLTAEGLTFEQIAIRVHEAAQAGLLMSDESVTFVRQHDENVRLAKTEGYNINDAIVFEEEGTAYHRKHRPEFTAMIRFIENFRGANPIILYFYEISRLIRNEDVANATFTTLRQQNVEIRVASQPQLRLNDEFSSVVLPLLIQFAQNESKMTSNRQKGAQIVRASAGTVRTSAIALGLKTTKKETSIGYRTVYEPDWSPRADYPGQQSPAWLIAQVFDRYEKGDSVTSICQWMNDSGFPTTTASTWYENTIMAILRNPHYAGYMRHNPKGKDGKRLPRTMIREQIVKDEAGNYLEAFEPIIERDRFWRIQNILDNRYKPRGPQRTVHRLSGIVFCARCDSKMFGNASAAQNPKHKKARSYRCPHSFRNSPEVKQGTSENITCVANNIMADGLEDIVYRCALRIVGNPDLMKAVAERPVETVILNEEERQAILDEIKEYQDLYDNESRPSLKTGYKAAMSDATERLTKLNSRNHQNVQSLHKALGSAEAFEKMWKSEDKTAIIMALRVLISKICITPGADGEGKRKNWQALAKLGWLCDYDRVTIHWTNGQVTNLAEAHAADLKEQESKEKA